MPVFREITYIYPFCVFVSFYGHMHMISVLYANNSSNTLQGLFLLVRYFSLCSHESFLLYILVLMTISSTLYASSSSNIIQGLYSYVSNVSPVNGNFLVMFWSGSNHRREGC